MPHINDVERQATSTTLADIPNILMDIACHIDRNAYKAASVRSAIMLYDHDHPPVPGLDVNNMPILEQVVAFLNHASRALDQTEADLQIILNNANLGDSTLASKGLVGIQRSTTDPYTSTHS